MESRPHSPAAPDGSHAFETTRWSLILRAGEDGCEDAMAKLCQSYWYPLYAYLRRCGHAVPDAQDLTQGFFLHLLSGDMLARATPGKGRFRSFLLGAIKNHLGHEQRHKSALKRGGGVSFVPIDEVEAERRFALEPAGPLTPDAQFERSWAFSLLEQTGKRLGEDYERAGRGEVFRALLPCLAGKFDRTGHRELGRQLGISEGAVAVAVHRMRRRYGELLREAIAETVETSDEVEAELAHLMNVVAGV
ncbi:sigma-70 family RNA polymerase sigma factor [Luteolibacter flavescens]|uniref:Sigma-70 family RNA polymerase sigma factor n=1 Tax=Luteolibacter flavescens TaxID=1859460 RepID=A0ABT3FPW2_9BACT|nr:sigma-70 family RNA polymerase sigma factor [Luteolibacter flavescens]MCW1885487.1 sigma-70 family RNA polymerase sigma factor [Luteolibacter flavescens]